MTQVTDRIETEEAGQRRFQAYPEYRHSGVEWLGEIPAHWKVKRLKHLSTLNDDTLRESTDPNFEMAYVDISSVDADAGITKTEEVVFANAPSRARRVVRAGDVIVSTVRTYLRAIAAIEEPESNLIVSTGFAVIRPLKLESSFASYALRAPHFVERVVANSTGVSYPAINAKILAFFSIPYPKTAEQRAITAFLDRETEKIDGLVERKKRLIALLQEKRTVLITRAVTRGLDSRTDERKTGSHVFPVVPKTWTFWKIRRLIRIVRRPIIVRPDTNYQEIGIRSWGKGIFHKDPVRGVLLGNKRMFRIEPGDLVLNIVFAWENAVAVVSQREKGMIASHRFPTFRPTDRVDLDYLLMILQSSQGRRLMEINSPGAAGRNKTLRVTQFLDEEIPLPNLNLQRDIVDEFRDKERRLAALAAGVHEAIDLLKEFRTALISAAVTGKIDVRVNSSETTAGQEGMR